MNLDQKRMELLSEEVHRLAETLSAKLEKKELCKDTAKLKAMYEACFVNTVDTTVKCLENGEVFLITGDIEAMWLRDSSAQVVQYLPFLGEYPELARMVHGLIQKQFFYINLDPYANAYNIEANGNCWAKDETDSNDWEWERKYEIDSLCYPVKLLHDYYQKTGDASIFTEEIHRGLIQILDTFETEQHHEEQSAYRFHRTGCPASDTLSNGGAGEPVKVTGMIWCGFRPSDDACKYAYLIPSNLFAATVCEMITEIAKKQYQDSALAARAAKVQKEVLAGVEAYGKVKTEKFGEIYAYEVDGLGHTVLMDDANVPSLLSLPWLGCLDANDEIYQNTRKFVLSTENPYYYEGTAAKGIGSPHTPDRYIWHIALSMQGLTSIDEAEKKELLETLVRTDAGTGYMHEGFLCDDPAQFTREWFAWSNSLFALFVTEQIG